MAGLSAGPARTGKRPFTTTGLTGPFPSFTPGAPGIRPRRSSFWAAFALTLGLPKEGVQTEFGQEVVVHFPSPLATQGPKDLHDCITLGITLGGRLPSLMVGPVMRKLVLDPLQSRSKVLQLGLGDEVFLELRGEKLE